MKNNQPLSHSPLLLQVVVDLFAKLRQNPAVYPIRFYKKNRRFRRNWQASLVK